MSWRAPTTGYGYHRSSVRPSGVFLCIVAVFVTTGVMLWSGFGSTRLNVFLFVLAGWVVSLCLHEFGHAIVAYVSGDRAVADRGYLTLNPLRYANPLLSIILPVVFLLIGGIGLPGGSVWVDHSALRGGRWTRTFVSLIGPGMNLVFAVLLTLPLLAGVDTFAHRPFWAGVAFLAFLQFTATLLNLLPIPGVDGGNAVEPWLDPQWRRGFAMVAPYGMIILFVLLAFRPINIAFFDLVDSIGSLFGLPPWLVSDGYGLFRFWR